MKTLFIDAPAGIAGDMLVAALVDAGCSWDLLVRELEKLGLKGWKGSVSKVMRGVFSASYILFEETEKHPYRSWKTIKNLIQEAPLAPQVRSRALRVFGLLAEAEARAHGIPIEEVGFHEVGAVDSILDIVGACIALELLGIEQLICSPLPMGHGTIQTAHGRIPLPAPATLEVLKNYPIYSSEYPGEHVTPTGAALVAALATPGNMPPMRVSALGYGAGTRNPGYLPNVVRALVGEGESGSQGAVLEITAQVDDLPGEAIPGLLESLLQAGAVDAFVAPILMKKGRSGFLLTTLAPLSAKSAVGDILLREGGTLGYRYSLKERDVLARDWEAVETEFGSVRIKLGRRGGELLTAKPEFEDCAALARAAGVPWSVVDAAARAAWRWR
jgi:uncharacterized protein (TIGR00299 family) protein